MQSVVVARGLTKFYGKTLAVAGIDFAVDFRECFGFLGPNGAGKTTTIKMMCCFSPLTSGELEVFGLPVRDDNYRAIKSRLGVMPQEENLDPDLTVEKNLLIYASYFDISRAEARRRAEELLIFLQLQEKRHERISTLSGGMKRRLLLARALINNPDLLILDEPTTGLDPQARHLVWEKLRKLKNSGVTTVLTTHYMEEAAQLCDRLVIMDHGGIIAMGRPRDLVAQHVGREVIEVFLKREDPGLMEKCRRWVSRMERAGDVLFLFLDGTQDVSQLLSALGGEDFLHRQATLEDVFLKLTGRELRE